MAKKFENYITIHCPERQQAELLVAETEVPKRNGMKIAISSWDEYQDKAVYSLIWKSLKTSTLV